MQALLAPCGSRGGDQIGGAGQQLKRIKELKFPSGLAAYEHLELTPPVRLSGPRAALVQLQLEELAGKQFIGARAPARRRTVKSPDLRLAEFPHAPPEAITCRMQLLEAYGLIEQTLGVLVAFERGRQQLREEARSQRRGPGLQADMEDEEPDDYDEL